MYNHTLSDKLTREYLMAYSSNLDHGRADYNQYRQLTKQERDDIVATEPAEASHGIPYEDLRYAQLVHIAGGGLTVDTSTMDLQVDTDVIESKIDVSNVALNRLISVLEASVLVEETYQRVVYKDATYMYICHAPAGVLRATAGWRVQRFTESTGERLLTVDNKFDQLATDLAAMSGITFIN